MFVRYKTLFSAWELLCGRKIKVNRCFSQELKNEIAGNFPLNEEVFLRRRVPSSVAEYEIKRQLPPSQPVNPHLLKVAILGEPNVGKSTLTNNLVKWKVCPVSKKVHTTRSKAAAILIDGNKQIVFLDTPGFVTPEHSIKHHLEVSLVADPEKSVREADLIAVVIDAACKWTNERIHEDILNILNNFKEKPSILVLNKVDVQKAKHKMLKITRVLTHGIVNGQKIFVKEKKEYMMKNPEKALDEIFRRTEAILKGETSPPLKEEGDNSDEENSNSTLDLQSGAKGWPLFSQIFMVSALEGDGVDDLRAYLLNSCKPGKWLYHESNIIDKSPHEIALGIIQEKFLDELPAEVPYNLSLRIKQWEVEESGSLRLTVIARCSKPRHRSIVIGNNGKRIAKSVEEIRQALQDTFRCEICLKILVK